MGAKRSKQLNRNLNQLFPFTSGYCRVCNRTTDHTQKRKYCSERCKRLAYAVLRMFTWSEVREKVLQRDGYQCVRCGKTEREGAQLEVDHIQPLSKGGNPFDEGNLQTLCKECHQEKGVEEVDYTGETHASVGEYLPDESLWSDQ